MQIVHVFITIDLPFVQSLKGRRKILHSIKDKLKNKNMCVADISGEYAKEGHLELLFFANSPQDANEKIENLEKMLETNFPDIEISLQYELI
ncbi:MULTISPECIES: DUF503 family protein [unclassified Nitratiruptor]|uniref:DUF503 family protein n=1 Tax=unclassified Nitratiruptor TaxID=2624044 RepID=UPI001915F9D9|nr:MULTISPECIES: DUF503 family protein [unclassified Nitratiruptor]BCD60512.1 hypothetical protein NitYY0810_C1279 [Nitratiruptor sp. YY08-10]BCD63999.1 hypothetical protein NitYY0814_C0842 [Nitratiruptor sp. YY08-14]